MTLEEEDKKVAALLLLLRRRKGIANVKGLSFSPLRHSMRICGMLAAAHSGLMVLQHNALESGERSQPMSHLAEDCAVQLCL